MNVVLVEAAVLGDLRAAGEDHAGVDLDDDVRSALIHRGIVPARLERGTGKDLLRAQLRSSGGFGQIGQNRVDVGGAVEPDQRSVVGEVEGIAGADNRSRGATRNLGHLGGIDGRLTVLGGDDHHRRVLKIRGFDRGPDAADGGVDKIQLGFKSRTGRAPLVRVAVALELLSHAHCLEIEPEDGRNRGAG